ncbi:MAG: DUF1080 domain-containing protein [Verrucomicrobia bacterium]|nr:DUF1080 domain-containing protein [Verrucomicrobiota bacterium]
MKTTRWLCAVLTISCGFAAEPGWVSLFNGRNLDGWVQRGGEAQYAVEDGCIVGTTVLKTPNSFLCTKKNYADFILEVDFKVDSKLNSGVQVRSECFDAEKSVEVAGKPKKIPAGRVHGYQVEIDPSARAFSGGIYDEGRRGWLFDLKNNEPARKAFKPDAWNHFRIEAIGDSIKTFLNGVPAADLKDSMTPSGFIALQVHGSKTAGLQVRWRNIRLKEIKRKAAAGTVVLCAAAASCGADGYQPLFDGKTSAGWRSIKGPDFPGVGWEVKNGVLSVLAGGKGGDIITAKKYANFDLIFEFRLTPGANSGVKYFIDPETTKSVGYEFQVLDDDKHPDAKLGTNGNRTIGSLYDIVPARTDKKVKPIGEWNEGRIVVNGTRVEHWLNGQKVLEFDRSSSGFKAHLEASKFKKDAGFCARKNGHILLQDHKDNVSFRNLRIKELP